MKNIYSFYKVEVKSDLKVNFMIFLTEITKYAFHLMIAFVVISFLLITNINFCVKEDL